MKSIQVIIFLLFSTSFCIVDGGLNQLCALIDYYDSAPMFEECFMYTYYGCWCGPGGSGKLKVSHLRTVLKEGKYKTAQGRVKKMLRELK